LKKVIGTGVASVKVEGTKESTTKRNGKLVFPSKKRREHVLKLDEDINVRKGFTLDMLECGGRSHGNFATTHVYDRSACQS